MIKLNRESIAAPNRCWKTVMSAQQGCAVGGQHRIGVPVWTPYQHSVVLVDEGERSDLEVLVWHLSGIRSDMER
jgi:hypothetical protein